MHSLAEYAVERDRLLQRITAALEADERVVAAWLSGSFGRGEADEWADYDLHVVLRDDSFGSFLKSRRQLYDAVGDVILLQDEIPGQGYVGDHFHLVLFSGAIEVDWSFFKESEARKPAGNLVLLERRYLRVIDQPALTDEQRRAHMRRWSTFFWAMAPIAIKYAGRSETQRAASQIGLLSRALISMWRLLGSSDGPDPWQPDWNRPLEDEIDRRLPKLEAHISPVTALDVTSRLCDEAEALQPALEEFGVAVDARVLSDMRALATIARREIASSRPAHRKYR